MSSTVTHQWRLTPGGCAFALALLLQPHSAMQAQGVAPGSTAVDSAALSLVRSYFAAYNDHDIDAVVRLLAPDFTWLNVAGDSVTIEVRGANAVRTGLVDYFHRLPSAHSDIEAITALGSWVSVRERARWVGADGPRSQASLSVYQVRDGLLLRVWYYPVVRE